MATGMTWKMASSDGLIEFSLTCNTVARSFNLNVAHRIASNGQRTYKNEQNHHKKVTGNLFWYLMQEKKFDVFNNYGEWWLS